MTAIGRSSTDRTTNVVLLSDTRLEEDLNALLTFGEGPQRLISPFLHESIHRWCFQSPVGNALTLLQMRIHKAALLSLAEPDSRSRHVSTLAESINRYETALAFLRPLDEGMSLFGEFDLKTDNKTRSWSEPLELAATFFAKPLASPENPELFIGSWAQGVLQPMRLAQACLDRKADVLGLPLRCDGDAYLPGYMLVRRMWLKGLHRDWRLANETDLFLMYFRSFIYDDSGLVAVLLDGSLDEIRGAQAVANHIIGRLEQFTSFDPDDLARYDEAVAGENEPKVRSRAIASTLSLDEALAAHGEQMLRQALDEYGREEDDRLLAALQFHEMQVLNRRQLQYVGSWAVDVEVKDGRYRVSREGQLIREGLARHDAAPSEGNGYIDVLQWIPRRERVCAILHEGSVVATESLFVSRHKQNDPELLSIIGERDEARERLMVFDQAVDEVVADSWAEIAVKHIRDHLPDMLNQAYLPTILNDTPLDQVESTSALMAEEGFYPMLHYNRQLIEGLAALSIFCSSLAPLENAVAAFLGHRGLSLERTLDAADDLARRYGVAKVYREDGYLLSSI